MPKIIVTQAFKFAHHGYLVEEFEVSQELRETTTECAALAIAEGWAVDAEAAEQAAREAAEQATREAAEPGTGNAQPLLAGLEQASAQPARKRAEKANDKAGQA